MYSLSFIHIQRRTHDPVVKVYANRSEEKRRVKIMQKTEFTSGQQIWGLAQKELLFRPAESKESISESITEQRKKYKSCSKQHESLVSFSYFFSYVLDV